MHAAVQSGGRSPKRLNGPSSTQQKSGSDGAQNCGSSKGKKRDRSEQGIDPAKRDRDHPLKVDDSEPGNFKVVDNVMSEIAKITEKGGLPHAEAVEKLVHLMQLDQTERKIDFAGRVMLADIITATESPDCLGRFVQLRGLPVLDDWLQEAHKGKSGEGSSHKETDKPIEELLLALLRALAKLPINLTALESCSIGKSVNHLRSHKNLEIQRKAKCLVDNWKRRVDAEMKSNEAKPVVSGQAARLAAARLCDIYKISLRRTPYCFYPSHREGERDNETNMPVNEDNPMLTHQVDLTRAMGAAHTAALEEITALRVHLVARHTEVATLRDQLAQCEQALAAAKAEAAAAQAQLQRDSAPLAAPAPPSLGSGPRTRLTAHKSV